MQIYKDPADVKYIYCGTCHMASLFLPLPRTATTTSCSSSSLLFAAFAQHLTSHPTSAPLFTTSLPLPSLLAVTSHQDLKGLIHLLALLLVSIRDAFLRTYALLPSQLSEDSHHEYFKALSYTSDHPKNSVDFYYRNWVLATNNISTASAPHQRC